MTATDVTANRVARAATLAHWIRGEAATTCCCHLCVDNSNQKDHHVAFCIQAAAKAEHPACLQLALLLARCSYTQRRKVQVHAWT